MAVTPGEVDCLSEEFTKIGGLLIGKAGAGWEMKGHRKEG